MAQASRRRPRLSRLFLAWSIAAAALLVSPAARAAEAIEVAAQRLPLNVESRAEQRVGQLVYRGGLVLSAGDEAFGGWSALRVRADGGMLTAVSDRGAWLELALAYDDRGDLIDVGSARLGRLIDPAGRPLSGYRWADAEGLASVPGGGWAVSFEHFHRIWLYPPAEPPFSAVPHTLATAPELARAPANGGLEVLARLGDERLLALTESLADPANGDRVGWIGGRQGWERLTYRPAPGFDPTDATALPDGDIVVLERRFGGIGLPGARLVRLAQADLKAGATLIGRPLALIEPPLSIDNFEGLDARLGPHGETLLYLLSDDNFFTLQRTLLLMFELTAE